MREVRAAIGLPCAPEEALRLFLDPQWMRGWWGVSRALVEPHAGGAWTAAWEDGQGHYAYVSSGTVCEYVPGLRLLIERLVYMSPGRPILGPMRLEVYAESLDAGSQLTVRQTGYGDGEHWDWYYAAVVSGWPQALAFARQFMDSLTGETGCD
jgi:hypothetical protein